MLLALLLACAALGCSATIHKMDGTSIEGKIVRGGDSYLVVERSRTQEGSVDEVTVSRNEIYKIDHPGLILGSVGTATAVAGASMLIAVMPGRACHDGDNHDPGCSAGLFLGGAS